MGTVQIGINVVALVVNDNRFGILEPQQMTRFGRTDDDRPDEPRFASLAKSFGAHGLTIDSVEEVGPALRDAFAANAQPSSSYRRSCLTLSSGRGIRGAPRRPLVTEPKADISHFGEPL